MGIDIENPGATGAAIKAALEAINYTVQEITTGASPVAIDPDVSLVLITSGGTAGTEPVTLEKRSNWRNRIGSTLLLFMASNANIDDAVTINPTNIASFEAAWPFILRNAGSYMVLQVSRDGLWNVIKDVYAYDFLGAPCYNEIMRGVGRIYGPIEQSISIHGGTENFNGGNGSGAWLEGSNGADNDQDGVTAGNGGTCGVIAGNGGNPLVGNAISGDGGDVLLSAGIAGTPSGSGTQGRNGLIILGPEGWGAPVPTSDPGVLGAVWVDENGFLKMSLGT